MFPTVVWVIGGRDADTANRLYAKVKHFSECKFYTDNWEAFSKVLPSQLHKVGKTETAMIERNNSNMRHQPRTFHTPNEDCLQTGGDSGQCN